MTRNVLFFIDAIDNEGHHIEKYLSLAQHKEEIHITTEFFDEVLRYFNYGCHDCLENGFTAIDITRIIDNGQQVYFDHDQDVEECYDGSNYRE